MKLKSQNQPTIAQKEVKVEDDEDEEDEDGLFFQPHNEADSEE